MARLAALMLLVALAAPALVSGRDGLWSKTKNFAANLTADASADISAGLGLGSTNSSEPWFCHGYPCPSFTSEAINGTTPFEIRTYAQTTWVTRCENNTNLHMALVKGRLPLYSYIRGSNSLSQKLPITTPLVVRITPNTSFSGNGSWAVTSNFTLAMYLNESQAAAGVPTSNNTHLSTLEEGVVYVLSFSGYATTATIVQNTKLLAAALTAQGYSYDADSFSYAQYGVGTPVLLLGIMQPPVSMTADSGMGADSPARAYKRHNEIWVHAEQGHDSAFTSAAMDQQR